MTYKLTGHYYDGERVNLQFKDYHAGLAYLEQVFDNNQYESDVRAEITKTPHGAMMRDEFGTFLELRKIKTEV